MNKRNYWPLLFIGIFLFTLMMIIWTVVSAINTPVNEDESFLKTYHTMDKNFNKIIESNELFKEKYDFKISINGKVFPLTTEDIFYSQRVLEKKSKHKDLFLKGKNIISINVFDKKLNNVNTLITFRVTKSTNNKSDINFTNKISNQKSFEFDIPIEGNWNITGAVETIDGNRGYFYIKTNVL